MTNSSKSAVELLEDFGRTEMMVIGACIIDPKAIYEASQVITDGKYFSLESSQVAYNVLLEMMKNSAKIDLTTVYARCNALEGNNQATAMFLTECTSLIASSAHVVDHAVLVKKQWKRNQLMEQYSASHRFLLAGGDPDDSIMNIQKAVMDVTEEKNERVQTMSDAIKDLDKKAKEIYERGGEMPGEEFIGVPELDRLFSGIEAGDVIMIAARPKVGKSSIANNVLSYSASANIPVYCASGEMPNLKAAARYLAAQSGVRTRSIEKGQYWDPAKESMRKAVSGAMDNAEGQNIYLSDAPLSLPAAISDINYYYHRYGVKRFLFDRVGLFDEVVNAKQNDVKMRDVVIASLRRVANVLGIGVIIFSQLTKEAEKSESKRPEGHMIFGGTGGPANCTKAALIYRPEAHKLSEFKAGPHKGTKGDGLAEVFTVYNNSDELRSSLVRFIGDRQMFASRDGDLFAQDFVPDDAIESPDDSKMDETFQDDDLPF